MGAATSDAVRAGSIARSGGARRDLPRDDVRPDAAVCLNGGVLPSVALPKGEVPMVADRIEREILIEAPVEVVWEVVTRPDQIRRWWSDEAEVDLRPGGAGTLTWNLRATNQRATVP